MRTGANSMRRSVAWALIVAAFAGGAVCAGSAQAWTYKVIHNFCSKRGCKDGASPQATLLLDTSGNLYGTSTMGANGGVAFELMHNSVTGRWSSKTLHQFDGITEISRGGLIIDDEGDLYGMTRGGPDGAEAYELTPNQKGKDRKFKVLATLGGEYPDGGFAYQGQAEGAPYDGVSLLYSTTVYGGATNCGMVSGCGTVFSLLPQGKTGKVTTIYEFCMQNCLDGFMPASGVIVGSDGNLYGTTATGGASNGGTIFELTNNSGTWQEDTLYAFCSVENCADGAGSTAALLQDGSGSLFGTTSGGGTKQNGGVVFKFTPGGSPDYTVLYTFCSQRNCDDGANPDAPLISDGAGNLYGTTKTGGGHMNDAQHLGGGTVFQLSGGGLQKLHSFCRLSDCADGEYPVGGLVMDPAGNLYGTTSQGGAYGAGVVFELSP